MKVLLISRKHCGKKKDCLLRATSFPTVFSRLVLQTRKKHGLYGKGLIGVVIERVEINVGKTYDCMVKV